MFPGIHGWLEALEGKYAKMSEETALSLLSQTDLPHFFLAGTEVLILGFSEKHQALRP